MAREEIAPAAITELCGTRGGVDDVREHDRQQRPREAAAAAGPGEELLDLLEDRVHVAHERKRVVALELHVAGSGYVLGQIARVAQVPDELSAPVHDQRRHADARQVLAHVEVDGCPAHRPRLAGARGEALKAREPGSKGGVICHRGREHGDRGVLRLAPDGHATLGCLDALLAAQCPVVVGRPRGARYRGVHDQCADAVGMLGGEHHPHWPAERVGQQRCAFAPRRIEHRERVFGVLLERVLTEDPVGEAAATAVEHDHAAEGS